MVRVAILDDYQDVALQMTDWKVLPADVEVQVFKDHLKDQTVLVERLPKLRLLTTTGMRNAAIDLQAATACGVVVCGTEAACPIPPQS